MHNWFKTPSTQVHSTRERIDMQMIAHKDLKCSTYRDSKLELHSRELEIITVALTLLTFLTREIGSGINSSAPELGLW